MSTFLHKTRSLLTERFSVGEKIQASQVYAFLHDKIYPEIDSEDVVTCVIHALCEMHFMKYHSELFTADYVVFNDPAYKDSQENKTVAETDAQIRAKWNV